ncbi:MAG: magnesium/cobalt transporter CorA [Chloroflexota bacterium]|nr:magnesium/cobalt transporter CorA [Chloroflexota bacterium]
MPVSRVLVRDPEDGFDESPELACMSDLIQDTRRVLWLDIQDPTARDLELLRQEFGFHELALEDVARRSQRAKIDRYDGYCFIVFFAVRPGRYDEIGLFIGPNYLVTVHVGDVAEITETAMRWHRNADRLGHGVGVPLYSLLDAIVDGYFPRIDEIAERIEAIEQVLFEPDGRPELQDVLALKRELLELRRVLAPEREVLNVLLRRDEPFIREANLVYFQDIYDHIIRVLESVDLYRDQLSGLLDAQLAVVSNRLNVTVKRMTALATVLMSVNLIASNYGMNFETMPELQWEIGYPYALGLMVAVGVILTVIFKRIDWL